MSEAGLDGAIFVVFFQTRLTMNLFGGKIAGAIEGQEIMTIDQHHLFEDFAALKRTESDFKCWSSVLGLNRIKGLTHRRITRHPAHAVNALQIVFGPLLIKGKQRRGFEGTHGEGGHEDIVQRDFGIAFSGLRKLTKDVLNRAQQGIGTQMFSHFGNDHAHGSLQPKMEL